MIRTMHRFAVPIWVAASFLMLAVSCSKNGASVPEFRSFGLISPPAQAASVNSPTLTIEIKNGAFTAVRAVNTTTGSIVYDGHAALDQPDEFFVYNVLLSDGENEISIEGVDSGGAVRTLPLIVTAAAQPNAEVAFGVSPQFAESTPVSVLFQVHTSIANPTETLIDSNGDGSIDHRQPFDQPLKVEFKSVGSHRPRILVRDKDGILVSSLPASSPSVRIVDPTVPDPKLRIPVGKEPADLEYDAIRKQLFVLARGSNEVSIHDDKFRVIRTVHIGSAVSLSGIAVDRTGNLYAVDSGGHQVFKYLAATNYSPDTLISPIGGFGSQGSGQGQFESPSDVTVEGEGDDLAIHVVDAGNNRVQTFNRAGVFTAEITGVSGGLQQLSQPRGLIKVVGGGFAVLDQAGTNLRMFASDGTSVGVVGQFQSATRISNNLSMPGFVVADPGAGAVLLVAMDGTLQRLISSLPRAAEAALVISDGRRELLVTANATQDALDVSELAFDPPGQAPLDVAQRFLVALGAGDFSAARSMVSPAMQSAFDQLLQDPAEAARVQAEGSSVKNLSVARQHDLAAVLSGTRTGASGTEPVDFVLRRDQITDRWLMTNF